jgi:hypothetical protein
MYYGRMDTFADIITAFGGPTKFAEAIGIQDFHAQTMKTRGSIPPAYWADTVSAALTRNIEGVTLEKLAELAKEKRPQTEAAQ